MDGMRQRKIVNYCLIAYIAIITFCIATMPLKEKSSLVGKSTSFFKFYKGELAVSVPGEDFYDGHSVTLDAGTEIIYSFSKDGDVRYSCVYTSDCGYDSGYPVRHDYKVDISIDDLKNPDQVRANYEDYKKEEQIFCNPGFAFNIDFQPSLAIIGFILAVLVAAVLVVFALRNNPHDVTFVLGWMAALAVPIWILIYFIIYSVLK